MSELISKNDNRATIRWKLMASVSALALAASVSHAAAEDASHPLLWIELGGDADIVSGLTQPFAPDFAAQTPAPAPYGNGNSPIGLQKPARYTFGGDASLMFQPQDSDWTFSAGIKYGRSRNKRDSHGQTNATIKFPNPAYEHIAALYPSYLVYFTSLHPIYTKYAPNFAGTTVTQSERHMVLDFQAGKDVGLGLFGHEGTSTFSAGVRMARFKFHTDVLARARPNANFYEITFPNPWGAGPHAYYTIYEAQWKSYYMRASAERTFNGVGPSLSWSATVPLAGNVEKGELELDWGINGSLLFGKQNAKISHHTTARYFKSKYTHNFITPDGYHAHDHYMPLYDHNVTHDRSRNVTVPNIGAMIGLSYRIENTKVSLGYRSDNFLNAMDVGIDAAKKKTLSFNGLFASVSVGLGD